MQRMWSSTTMARSTVNPACRAISAFGRMPAETTTMSQGSSPPSLKRRPITPVSSDSTADVILPRWTWTPMASICAFRMAPPVASSCISIRCPARCTTCTSHPWLSRPRAASSPSKPPPITAARLLRAAWATMALQSSMPRKANTPGRNSPLSSRAPSMGGMKARLPVAISSTS